MSKIRKDSRGRVLHKNEMYIRSKELYCYSYTDALGKRRYLYAKSLVDLRDKEADLERNKVDRLEMYVGAKADVNYLFDRFIATKKGIRNTTKVNYVYTYDRYVRNGFGKKRITEVRYSDVLAFYQALIEGCS